MPRSRHRVALLAGVGVLLVAALVVWAHVTSEPESPTNGEFVLIAASGLGNLRFEHPAGKTAVSAALRENLDGVPGQDEPPECWQMQEPVQRSERYFCKVLVEPQRRYLWASYLLDPDGTITLYRTGDMPIAILLTG